jgi:two-component system response regulator PilR (NtrC family)
LNVIELKIPSLRERKEDIPLLVEFILSRMKGDDMPLSELTPAAMDALLHYSYPGNVRELENILERATALCASGRVDLDDLQLAAESVTGEESASLNGKTLDDYVNQIERQMILDALEKTKFNRTAAARLLGVSFRSLRYRIERLGIEDDR